ncbi:MAG: glycosyltransferase family 4 protein [candidate division KSB1 bacterium]|nr:glycosyltransferase family 4 protein [candidate division KSB1 bacterium]MDZ7318050.1 glycosyltransferase family 4 protein [candidate division KSB1 bacterium]MDZ7341330.1 glycosyltransferase family 4 protein [candidate division KSB1 bacterium]
MHVLFLRAGSFSHVNYHLLQALSRKLEIVEDVDAGQVLRRRTGQISGWQNTLHAIFACRRFWNQMQSKNSFAFTHMSAFCDRRLQLQRELQCIFQTQCKFSISQKPTSLPYFIYTDLTQRMTDRLWSPWALRGSAKETARWLALEEQAFQRADKIFTFNGSTKSSLLNDYSIADEKVVVVGSGVNLEAVAEHEIKPKNEHGFQLFFMSTEFERQGGPLIVQAYEWLQKFHLNLKFVIGGKFPSGLPVGIETFAQLNRQQIDEQYRRSTIFLMPGKLGGLQSVLEAMSRKCVCIVSDSNVLMDGVIRDRHTGCVVRWNDPKHLAETIIELYLNESLTQQIAKQAYAWANQHSTWEHVCQRLLPHLQQ